MEANNTNIPTEIEENKAKKTKNKEVGKVQKRQSNRQKQLSKHSSKKSAKRTQTLQHP